MKVLFICSGNKDGNPTALVFNQGESLRNTEYSIDFFTISGKGAVGYLKNVFPLVKYLNRNSIKIVHAHYSLSAFVATLAFQFIRKKRRPKLVVSLLGSDAYMRGWAMMVTKFLYKTSWQTTIVKTLRMKNHLKMGNAVVLPNGVDINRFIPYDKEVARDRLNLNSTNKIIVFIADPSREEKNFDLAEKAVKLLCREDVMLIAVYDVPNTSIPDYINSADLLLLTSVWEGSPNVVKEAMACNLPIVSTDVGDVSNNISDLNGCFIAQNNELDISKKIAAAIDFNKRTNGREKLISMGLDSKSVAQKLIKIYEDVLQK